jgi:hypothetical protein
MCLAALIHQALQGEGMHAYPFAGPPAHAVSRAPVGGWLRPRQGAGVCRRGAGGWAGVEVTYETAVCRLSLVPGLRDQRRGLPPVTGHFVLMCLTGRLLPRRRVRYRPGVSRQDPAAMSGQGRRACGVLLISPEGILRFAPGRLQRSIASPLATMYSVGSYSSSPISMSRARPPQAVFAGASAASARGAPVTSTRGGQFA